MNAATCREKEKVNYVTVPIPERLTEAPAASAPKASGPTKAGPSASKRRAKPLGRSGKPEKHNAKPGAARPGTKTAKILALLQRRNGASLNELRKATGWQAHSVRGFLAGTLKKKMGLWVRSTKRSDGERAYRVSTN